MKSVKMAELLDDEYVGSVDVMPEVSLYEYGLMHRENADGSIDIVYGIGADDCMYNRFTTYLGYAESDFPAGESWFDLSAVLRFVGMTADEWNATPLISRVHDAISYHGTENILGTDYTGGFKVDATG